MSDEEKNNVEWKPLQAIRTNFSINDIIKPEFLEEIKKSFNTKNVDIINFAIYLEDDNDSEENNVADIITVAHKTTDDTKEKRVIVDMNNSESYVKIKEAFENYKG
ncbi:MAG: hypothetical protein LBM96_12490 [Methanobrevibacter sp.]|jgi:hypothetical protein|nr:hypothetical protein [Candidatus Methanoflexus mossambicus]